MIHLSQAYYKPIQQDIEQYLYAVMWEDIVALLDKDVHSNARYTALIDAITKGRVVFKDGQFTGSFNMRISRELVQFATYDKRRKLWTGNPPVNILTAAQRANAEGEALNAKLEALVRDIPARVEATIDKIIVDMAPVVKAVESETDKDLKRIGVSADVKTVISEKDMAKYRVERQISIKAFTDEQTAELLALIRKNTLEGYNRRTMIAKLQERYSITKNKASFLARQETSLLVSNIRNQRFSQSGIDVAIWSSSSDARVVGTPGGKYGKPTEGHGNHYNMNGMYVKVSDPTVYAETLEDAKAGNWKPKSDIGGDSRHAGESYNCRCVYKPVLL